MSIGLTFILLYEIGNSLNCSGSNNILMAINVLINIDICKFKLMLFCVVCPKELFRWCFTISFWKPSLKKKIWNAFFIYTIPWRWDQIKGIQHIYLCLPSISKLTKIKWKKDFSYQLFSVVHYELSNYSQITGLK